MQRRLGRTVRCSWVASLLARCARAGRVLKKFLAGALSGGIGSLAGNPFDVMKTRMMANEGAAKGIMHYGSEVYKSSGLVGFYKGIEANQLIINAIFIFC
jgi:hypothetical protein